MDPYPNLDVENILMHSSINSFKNTSVHRADMAIPSPHTNGVQQTITEVFTLAEDTDFVQLMVYATDYSNYFRFLDGAYHDKWMMVEQSFDYLLRQNPPSSLYYFNVDYKIDGDQVTVTITIPAFFPTTNWTAGMVVPIAFVEYTLDR